MMGEMDLVPLLLGVRGGIGQMFWKMRSWRCGTYTAAGRWRLGNRQFGLPGGQDGLLVGQDGREK